MKRETVWILCLLATVFGCAAVPKWEKMGGIFDIELLEFERLEAGDYWAQVTEKSLGTGELAIRWEVGDCWSIDVAASGDLERTASSNVSRMVSDMPAIYEEAPVAKVEFQVLSLEEVEGRKAFAVRCTLKGTSSIFAGLEEREKLRAMVLVDSKTYEPLRVTSKVLCSCKGDFFHGTSCPLAMLDLSLSSDISTYLVLPPQGAQAELYESQFGVPRQVWDILSPKHWTMLGEFSIPRSSGRVREVSFQRQGNKIIQRWDEAVSVFPLSSLEHLAEKSAVGQGKDSYRVVFLRKVNLAPRPAADKR